MEDMVLKHPQIPPPLMLGAVGRPECIPRVEALKIQHPAEGLLGRLPQHVAGGGLHSPPITEKHCRLVEFFKKGACVFRSYVSLPCELLFWLVAEASF